ncbi:MarR family winged helix-turn-helix transcriptional regulator [Microbacterium sp. PMB16]|uniref:MarR family winged helix-turn-helix transcriptional regulator n=1 Tax=Microbacterium sp. PMB16 TaxID=3120157 RepID=UPI003F4C2421
MTAPSPRVSYAIGRLDRALTASMTVVLAENGITVAEFTALSILRDAPGLSNAQMARRTLVRPQSMIQVITSLERAGLIEREPSPHHSRVLKAAVTPLGRRVLKRCDKGVADLEARFLNGIAVDEQVSLRERLTECARLLSREADPTA